MNSLTIYPLSRIISRQVRENACQWLLTNVTPLTKLDRPKQKELANEERKELSLHLLSLALEMMAAAELANEDIYYLFVIKQALISVRSQRSNFRLSPNARKYIPIAFF